MFENFNISSQKYGIFGNFTKINIIFGANSNGKTTLINNLQEIFLGNERNSKINFENIDKNNFNVVKIDSQFQINELTKLTSKNRNKLKLENIIKDQNNIQLKDELSNFLNNCQKKLDETINKNSLIKWQIKDKDVDDIFLELIEGNISASRSEENVLYIKEKTDFTLYKNVILIDDFDAFLNEDNILGILNFLESLDSICFLTTNKPESLFYSCNKYSNFVIRNSNLVSLNKLLEFSNDESDLNSYLCDSLYLNSFMDSFSNNRFVYSIGRTLVNNNINLYCKKDDFLANKVNIFCASKHEFDVLSKVLAKLNDN